MNDQVIHLSWISAVAHAMGLRQTQVVTTRQPCPTLATWRHPQIHALAIALPIISLYLLSTLHLSLGQFLIYTLVFGLCQSLISLFTRDMGHAHLTRTEYFKCKM